MAPCVASLGGHAQHQSLPFPTLAAVVGAGLGWLLRLAVCMCVGCEELGELVFQTEQQRQGEGKRWVSAHRSTGGQGMAAGQGKGGIEENKAPSHNRSCAYSVQSVKPAKAHKQSRKAGT
jgi:hypothetical protein